MKSVSALISNNNDNDNLNKGKKVMPERVLKLLALIKASSFSQFSNTTGFGYSI
jgi:hypothetical protein